MSPTTRREFVTAAVLTPLLIADPIHEGKAADNVRPARPAPSSERFDYVVAGAGHNSLICAAYLSKAGYRVLVLEGQAMIGGGCKTSEMLLPGFKEDWCSSTHGIITGNPMLANNELHLDHYGYELLNPDTVIHFPFSDGASFTVFRNDLERTADTIAQVSKKDAATFKQMAAQRASALPKSPDGPSKTQAQTFLKTLGEMSGYTAARQVWESRHMQAAALSGGKFSGPSGSDPGTGLQAFSMLSHLAGRPMPKGGSGMLCVALGRLIEANNGVIMTSMPVTQFVVEGGQCKGVECADGSKFRADIAVVSTMHVKHMLNMAPRELWGETFTQNVALMQPETGMFAFHYALQEPPRYKLSAGGAVSSPEAAIMEDPASIFVLNEDAARGELHMDDYPLQICHQSVFDTSRVPDGYGSVKVQGYVPYDLKQGAGQWDEIKDQVADAVMARYMALTANLTQGKILAKHLVSPLDMERGNASMWRGSVHGFDNRFGLSAPYRMPIPGLYQTGDCTAPGGGISGFPGRNTADLILRDRGRDISQVVAIGAGVPD